MTYVDNESTWYCDDKLCAMCDDGTIPENPGNLECVETVTIDCCTSIPEHGVPIHVDEDYVG